jgi:hypothetical protein
MYSSYVFLLNFRISQTDHIEVKSRGKFFILPTEHRLSPSDRGFMFLFYFWWWIIPISGGHLGQRVSSELAYMANNQQVNQACDSWLLPPPGRDNLRMRPKWHPNPYILHYF